MFRNQFLPAGFPEPTFAALPGVGVALLMLTWRAKRKITKYLRTLLVASTVVLGLSAPPSYGGTFEFSYIFNCPDGNGPGPDGPLCAGIGDVVSGSFSGTQVGTFVDNISDVALSFNGIAYSGALYTGTFVTGQGVLPGPVVSFDVAQNDFFFYNPAETEQDYAAAVFFYIDFNYSNQFGSTPYSDTVGPAFEAGESPPVQADWFLTNASSAPEPASLGLSCLGIGILVTMLVPAARRSRKNDVHALRKSSLKEPWL